MKIGIEKFLNIFFSIMKNDEIDSIDVMDIVETIKILYSSDEFELISPRLNINEFNEEQILNNKYTIDFDENGIISFDVPDEDKDKILDENKVDAGLIKKAIDKRAIAKFLTEKYGQSIQFKYDNPNGVYNLPRARQLDYEAESSLFTDGECINNTYYKSTENDSSTRTVKINDATFSLFAYYVDGLIDKIELRGKYDGDYFVLLNEAKRVLNNILDSYDLVIPESPKVYKFKIH